MLKKFNIKTFPAETIVFQDGLFCPELSTLKKTIIDKNYDLPIHLIYIGKISKKNNLDIVIHKNVKNQKIFLSIKVKVNSSTEFNITIKNNGAGSDLRGFIIIENKKDIKFNINAYHLFKNTGIFVKTRLLAYKNSVSELVGTAYISKHSENCRSDIEFSVMSDKNAKIILKPIQKISAVPENASHGADIAHYSPIQIRYLYQSGLNDTEVHKVLKEAFVNNIDIIE